MADYDRLKRKALGFSTAEQGADPFMVNQPLGMSLIPRTSFNDLLDISAIRLEELKRNMREYSEYSADKDLSHQLLAELIKAIDGNITEETKSLLERSPAAEWLSKAFLDDSQLATLLTSVKNADNKTKAALSAGIRGQLSRLATFKSLFEAILKEAET